MPYVALTRQLRESGRAESLRGVVLRMYGEKKKRMNGRGGSVFTKGKTALSRKIAVKEHREMEQYLEKVWS